MDIILNQVAIWLPTGTKKMHVSLSPLGTPYREKDSVVYKRAQKELQRYVKDYTCEEVKYSLFVRTFSEDKALVEKTLDTISKKITKEFVLTSNKDADLANFQYTPFYLEENKFNIGEEE